MKSFFKASIIVVVGVIALQASQTFAQFADSNFYQTNPFIDTGFSNVQPVSPDRAYIEYLLNLYFNPVAQNNFGFNPGFQNTSFNYSVPNNNYQFSGGTPGFTYAPVSGFSENYLSVERRPDVETRSARDIEDDSAELRGEVDMNDYRNGIVFFVYGQDEDMIEDVEDDYDEYDDVEDDEESDDFEVVRIDRDLDDNDSFSEDIDDLEEDERYYFIICVEYEDDNDESLECGDVEDFETDDDNSDDEPDAETNNASDIDDDSAELRGEVDMNDFENGRVFFVWGEDEDDIDDVDTEDRYTDVNENDEDLQKQSVQTNFDGNDNFELDVFNLDNNTDIYFRICVEYEDEDNDDTLECGDVEDFETDN